MTWANSVGVATHQICILGVFILSRGERTIAWSLINRLQKDVPSKGQHVPGLESLQQAQFTGVMFDVEVQPCGKRETHGAAFWFELLQSFLGHLRHLE